MPSAGVWFDARIEAVDITSTKGIGSFQGVFGAEGLVADSSPATLANVTGFFVCITANGSATSPYYFGGVSITPPNVAPSKITEFGDASREWNETNLVLAEFAPPQDKLSGPIVGTYGDHPLSPTGTSAAGDGDLVSVWEDQSTFTVAMLYTAGAIL